MFLTTNSLPKPKAMWKTAQVQALVSEIKALFPALMEEL